MVSKPQPPEPLKRTELPSGPWQHISADLMTPSLPSGDHLLVVVDYYSRYMEVEVLRSTTADKVIASLKKIFLTHGLPISITTNNGLQFRSEEFCKFVEEERIEHTRVTLLWPQAKGEVERQNRSLLKRIKIAQIEKRNWKEELRSFLIMYRTTPHSTTGVSPAELLFHKKLRTCIPGIEEFPVDDQEERKNKLKPTFRPEPYRVLDKLGNSVVVETPDGVQYKRNSTHVKKFLERSNVPECKMSLSPPVSNSSTEHQTQPSVNESDEHSGEIHTQTMGKEIEDSVYAIEELIDQLDVMIKECKHVETQAEEKEKEEHDAQLREKRFNEEMLFEKAKLEQKLKFEKKNKEKNEQDINAKLPKLVITKFKGYERAKNIPKTKFGKESEIVNAYVSSIMSIPVIYGVNPNKVSQFYEKLCSSIQALETMGKLREVNGYVRMTLNKLEGIRGDLVRTNDNWQEWKFNQLVEVLRKWTMRNPSKLDEDPNHEKPPSGKPPFKPLPKFSRHGAADYLIVKSRQKCNGRHHTSICDRDSQQMLLATGKGAVIYPVIVVDVDGIKCRALLDTGAGSSYASAALIKEIGKQLSRMEQKRIDTMTCSTNQKIYQYDVKISRKSQKTGESPQETAEGTQPSGLPHRYHLWGNYCIEKSVTSIYHGTRKYLRQLQKGGRNLRGAFQTKFKSHTVWQALRKLLKRLIYTCLETQVGPEHQLPCLLATKSHLAKKGLIIPRLELVSAHMAANLVENVKNALEGQPVTSVHGWLDSIVALHWIRGEGSAYKQFVANRVNKIRDKAYIQWRHVGTDQNPADIGSRGCQADNLGGLWFKGPEWLTEPDLWLGDILTEPNKETEAEAKLTREIFAAITETKDNLDEEKKSVILNGPLTTFKTDKEVRWWVQRAQENSSGTEKFEKDKLTLNLQKNSDGLYACHSRIQGNYPIYLPPRAVLSEKLVQDAHMLTLHGGVGLTMALIRSDYWIPRLRQLTKKVINGCFGCKKFQTKAFGSPPPGNLPIDRTMGSIPFQVLGLDYAGPILYGCNKKRDGKAYILLFACSLTRAIHFELLSN
ncbi:Uncharacterized protein K02A2.6 [Stylophora pistillata]|uniref:Uncharacterized protein K02A2.6 n=1 Tax=Stylophora pistillata TaxID=50429 RepID=A0A2B4SWA2_STYPI|nr:Uncharacterized protein K02A2.6 [Stylophora pistillata]